PTAMNCRSRGTSASSAASVGLSFINESYVPDSCIGLMNRDRLTVGRVPDKATLPAAPAQRLRYDDPGMRRVRLGLFAAALATFALLYTPQPLLPLLSADFRTSPAASSLVMSAGTGALAVAIIGVSSLSEVFGRRRVMVVSALAAVLLGLAASPSPSLGLLVVIRVAQGFALAGVPAVAMAYLAEEVEAFSLGRAMGLYIAGNAIGGLSGRVIAGALAEDGGW